MMPSEAVIKRAENILATQSFIPLSPAAVDETGNVCLCAAASLAAAGLESKFGADVAAQFRGAACSLSTRSLEEVFERLDWSPLLCAEMRACNDAAAPDSRLKVVSLRLSGLFNA